MKSYFDEVISKLSNKEIAELVENYLMVFQLPP